MSGEHRASNCCCSIAFLRHSYRKISPAQCNITFPFPSYVSCRSSLLEIPTALSAPGSKDRQLLQARIVKACREAVLLPLDPDREPEPMRSTPSRIAIVAGTAPLFLTCNSFCFSSYANLNWRPLIQPPSRCHNFVGMAFLSRHMSTCYEMYCPE